LIDANRFFELVDATFGLARHTAQGLTPRSVTDEEILRCLGRYTARQAWMTAR
jgi:hypothetical protein